ncbi:MAG: hypothetical protein ACYDBV_09390 [Nitrospiria bacterium]
MPLLMSSLLCRNETERYHSRQQESFSAKVIAALRNEFGGHEVRKPDGSR